MHDIGDTVLEFCHCCQPQHTQTPTKQTSQVNNCIIAVIAVKSCEALTDPTNGQVQGSDTHVGATVTYRCNEGYNLVGSSSRTCQESGDKAVWSGNEPTCYGKYVWNLTLTHVITISL